MIDCIAMQMVPGACGNSCCDMNFTMQHLQCYSTYSAITLDKLLLTECQCTANCLWGCMVLTITVALCDVSESNGKNPSQLKI